MKFGCENAITDWPEGIRAAIVTQDKEVQFELH